MRVNIRLEATILWATDNNPDSPPAFTSPTPKIFVEHCSWNYFVFQEYLLTFRVLMLEMLRFVIFLPRLDHHHHHHHHEQPGWWCFSSNQLLWWDSLPRAHLQTRTGSSVGWGADQSERRMMSSDQWEARTGHVTGAGSRSDSATELVSVGSEPVTEILSETRNYWYWPLLTRDQWMEAGVWCADDLWSCQSRPPCLWWEAAKNLFWRNILMNCRSSGRHNSD